MLLRVLLFTLVFTYVASDAVGDQLVNASNVIVEWTKLLRNESTYDQFEQMATFRTYFSESWLEATISREVIHQLFSILKAIVPISNHPTQEKLKALSTDFAEAVTSISQVIELGTEFPEFIYKASSNTTLLKGNHAATVNDPSPSNFINALRLLEMPVGKDGIYEFAETVRCVVDKAKLLSNDVKFMRNGETEEQEKIMNECRMANQSDKFLGSLLAVDMIEFFSSEKNTEAFLTDFSILMEALKNLKSYESSEAFLENIKKSKQLKATVQLWNETQRCVAQVFNIPPEDIEEARISVSRLMKMICANPEDPTTESILKELIRAGVNLALVARNIEKQKTRDEREVLNSLRNCLMPTSDAEEIRKLTPVLNGNVEQEEKMLEQVANISKTFHSLYVFYYGHLRSLRNRVGVTDEVNAFITTALTKWREFSLADGTTEEGKAAQERSFEELRNSFINLSSSSKKLLSKRFPYGTVATLAAIF